MKRIFLLLLLLPPIINAQYNNERSTEQSFEQSNLYFTSHYLNTSGIGRFKDVATGFIDDPFLNVYLNPALAPADSVSAFVYLDFRGDRKVPEIVKDYYMPLYYGPSVYIEHLDPRWITSTRNEPEPVFSLGIITRPLKESAPELVIGGTYQLIRRQERFYNMPYLIYNARYMYDAFNEVRQGSSNIPVIDRYSGKDEMINEAHLYSAFLSWRLFSKLSLGAGINGVNHSRSGAYGSYDQSEFGSTSPWHSKNSNMKTRTQDYDHLEFNVGGYYQLTRSFGAGVKAGILNGNATQQYTSDEFYSYERNLAYPSDYSGSNYFKSSTLQNWNHDGTTKHMSLNFSGNVSENSLVRGYYRYSYSGVDLSSSSRIMDTSFYYSVYTGSTYSYSYTSQSRVLDTRQGTGSRKKYNHEAMISSKWNLNKKTLFYAGIYINSYKEDIYSSEPAGVYRMSRYTDSPTDPANPVFKYSNTLSEIKRLQWEYSVRSWSVQIPVMIEFRLTDYFGLMFGINRILNNWDISDRTTAFYALREMEQSGTVKQENNFAERYTQPSEKTTEYFTDFISRFDVTISKKLNIHMWLNPDFANEHYLAQWWLSLEAQL